MQTFSFFKRFTGKSLRSSAYTAAAAAFVFCAMPEASAQTINIGPNQYAFRFTTNPNYGLFFNATSTQYEFRNGLAAPIFAFNADNGRMTTNLEFSAGSDYLVGANRYAFRSSVSPNVGLYATTNRIQFLSPTATPIFSINTSDGKFDTDLEFNPGKALRVPAGNFAIRSATAPNAGLYFGAVDYEFRTNTGAPAFRVNSSNGNLITTGTVQAAGGNSTNWNQAHSWGNHATAGYINAEVDPKIGAMSVNQLPRWSGTQLLGSIVSADANNMTITSPSANPVLVHNSTSASGNPLISLRRNNAQIGWLQAFGDDFYVANQQNGNMYLRTSNLNRMTINGDGNVGINAVPTADANLRVERPAVFGYAVDISVGNGVNTDARALRASSVTNPGFGIGIEGSGGWRGVVASNPATDYTGTSYGLFATSTGTGTIGTRMAVYGSASGGATNWAGYFASGNVYVTNDLRIGTLSGATGYKVSVNGKIMCTELRVQALAAWPDYVFNTDYKLMPLSDLEQYIATEKHLPGIPAAAEIENGQGFDVGEMQRVTVEKLEELTLYILELKRENDALRARIDAIEK